MTYEVDIGAFPRKGQSYDSPSYHEARKLLRDAFTSRFSTQSSTASVPIIPDEFLTPTVITCSTSDKTFAFEVHQWIRQGADDTRDLFDLLRCGIGLANDGQTVASARWVELSAWSQGADVSPTIYPVVCEECLLPDADHPPNPFPIDQRFFRKPIRELYYVSNALYLANDRVLGLFRELVPDEFEWGEVVVSGRSEQHGEWYWLRPRHWLKGRANWIEGNVCPKCGIPRERIKRDDQYPDVPELLRTFGPWAWNLARIERWGSTERFPLDPRPALVSGGLFAVLYNHGVKGLLWPGRWPFISVRPDEPTLEPKRRFADMFAGKADKILKVKDN